jgi:formylmethanofuran dehydrogenase subunit B
LGTLPSVAIVGVGSPEASGDVADVVFAVGVPGESAGGSLWDERRATIAYAPPAGHTAELSAAGILTAIHERLTQKKAAAC